MERNHPTDCSPIPLADGRFSIVAALPFGSIHANQLAVFASDATTLGTDEIRFAPARRLVLICVSEAAAARVFAAAREAGLIVDADDPRTYIFACPGSPACASGNIPARDIAAVVASKWTDLIDRSKNVHISGCAKGCAHPAPSAITLVGNGNRTALVVAGSARDQAVASVPTADLEPALTRLAGTMRANEPNAQRLAAAFAGD